MNKRKIIFRLFLIIFIFTIILTNLGCKSCKDEDEDEEIKDIIVTLYKTSDARGVTLSANNGYITIASEMMIREGYTFLGYYDPSGILVINESGKSIKLSNSVSLYAKWEASNVTINFNPDSGSLKEDESTITTTIGSSITKFPVPYKEGYKFLGWSNGGTKVSDDKGNVLSDYQLINLNKYTHSNLTINLVANYEIIKFKVTIDYNDSSMQSTSKTLNYGESFDLKTLPEKDTGSKYIIGWSTNPYTLVEFDGSVNSDMTIYAIWKEYKLFKLHTNIDDEIIEIRVCNGEDYNLNEFEKDGYVFDGWYTSNLFSGLPIKSISYNYAYTEFFAKTSLVEYEIEFIENGGDKVESIKYTVVDSMNLPKTSLENFEFIGWCKNEDLSDTPIVVLEKGTANVTKLFAKYKGETKYITLNANGGSVENDKIEVEYGTSYTLPIPTYDKYEFKGWYTEANSKGTQLTDASGISLNNYYSDNMTLYAHYRYIDSIDVADAQSFLKIKDNPTGIYNILNNIDLSNVSWTPFDFKGIIYGNEYIISNLTYSASSGHVGTFLTMSGKIYDLTLDVNISSSSNDAVYVGGLCSILSGTVDNVTITGTITGIKCSIGGIAGQVTGTVTNCVNKATVTATPYDDGNGAGGICAHYKSGTISDSVNYGTITGKIYTGGICGNIEPDVGLLNNLVNYGNVNGTSYVGGISGYFYRQNKVTLNDLENYGNISGTVRVGGIFGMLHTEWGVGYNNSSTTQSFINLKNSGEIIGTSNVGGIFGKIYGNVTCNSSYSAHTSYLMTALINTGNISGTNYIGGLIGYGYSDGTSSYIKNSSSSANITAEAYVGGLAGYLDNISIIDSSNENTVLNATGYILNGTTYQGFIGGYAGYLSGTITNCHNKIDITYNERGSCVGGIVGELTGSMNNCSNSGTIYAPKSYFYIGGLIGNIWQSKTISLENLTNTGDVTGLVRTGGIIGNLCLEWDSGYNNSITTNKFNNLTNSGNIAGTTIVGGIIGHLYGNITCNSSYTANTSFLMNLLTNTGNITGTTYVGGLIGKGKSDGTSSYITISKSSAKITAEAYVGGLAGALNNIAITDSSNENSVIEATSFVLNGTSYEGYIGGYVGSGYIISGCTNDIDITYNERGYCVGGLAGYLSGNIKNSTNNGNVYAPKSTAYVGGLVGDIWISTTTTLENLINTGDVTGLERTGGIIGNLVTEWDSGYNSSITIQKFTNLKNSGNIIGTSSTGGIIGFLYGNVTCKSSYTAYTSFLMNMFTNTGNVTGTTYVGGLIGYGQSDGSASCISISSSSGVITGEVTIGGLAGRLKSISIDECSNEGTKVEATSYYIGTDNINYVELGGYVGIFLEPAKISNCTNNIDIIYNSIGAGVGGLIGNSHGSVENCLNTGNIYAPKAVLWVGGIAGRFWNGGTLTLTNVENRGKITGTEYTGGITGRIYTGWDSGYNSSITTQSFTNLKNSGEVIGTNYVAGLIGDIYGNVTCKSGYTAHTSFIMLQLYNTGKVTGTKYVAGFIGNFYTDGSSSKIEIYENTGVITGSENVDNLVGNKSNLTIVEE